MNGEKRKDIINFVFILIGKIMEKSNSEIKDKVNRYAACSRCANNGGKFCDNCNGINHWKMLLAAPVEFDESRKRQKEYQREYYQNNKKKIQEKRRAYFLKYYHEVLKKKPDEVTKKRLLGLKYYYDHHDEIRAKRNAKKKSRLAGPEEVAETPQGPCGLYARLSKEEKGNSKGKEKWQRF